jgi:hypothetical protein
MHILKLYKIMVIPVVKYDKKTWIWLGRQRNRRGRDINLIYRMG